VLYQSLTDSPVTGPCFNSNVATINFDHTALGDTAIDGFDSFMLFGWFNVYLVMKF